MNVISNYSMVIDNSTSPKTLLLSNTVFTNIMQEKTIIVKPEIVLNKKPTNYCLNKKCCFCKPKNCCCNLCFLILCLKQNLCK